MINFKEAKKILIKLLPKGWDTLLTSGKDIEEVKKCQKVITASGTVTLELAMMNIPMIIMYRLSPLTYLIMKNLVKLKCQFSRILNQLKCNNNVRL